MNASVYIQYADDSPVGLDHSVESLLDLRAVSKRSVVDSCARLAFHGLLNSKPFGATGLSVCPRGKPVNLASRSITCMVLVFCVGNCGRFRCHYFAGAIVSMLGSR
jgi:hypothetical protein